jgi:hypothetical protein
LKQRLAWIESTKAEGDDLIRQKQLCLALGKYMVALCGFDSSQTEGTSNEASDLKIKILNNMALGFMRLAETEGISCETADVFLRRSKTLLEKVLALSPRNDKALLRICNVKIDLEEFEETEQLLKQVEDVAFQSEHSQRIYDQVKKIQEKIADPGYAEKRRNRYREILQKHKIAKSQSGQQQAPIGAFTKQQGSSSDFSDSDSEDSTRSEGQRVFRKEDDWYFIKK